MHRVLTWIVIANLDTVYETSTEFFDPCEDTDILEAELIEQSVVVHTESWLINEVYVEHNVVVPAEEWEIGDPMIDGTRIETYSVPLYVVDFEADWQGVLWGKFPSVEALMVSLTCMEQLFSGTPASQMNTSSTPRPLRCPRQ